MWQRQEILTSTKTRKIKKSPSANVGGFFLTVKIFCYDALEMIKMFTVEKFFVEL